MSLNIWWLRLWIELLKNAYYKKDVVLSSSKDDRELETLPNIDINIKVGNSLISRFAWDADLKQTLRGSKWNINSYRIAVGAYKNATEKNAKRELVTLIDTIKDEFKTAIGSKQILDLKKLESDYYTEYERSRLFEVELNREKKSKIENRKKTAFAKIEEKRNEIEEIKNNKIYQNAFEWRFEFPEVLNDDGDFVGFDGVIGNPAYGVQFSMVEKQFLEKDYSAKDDIYTMFLERGNCIGNTSGLIGLIIPIFWLTGEKYLATRKFISNNVHFQCGITLPYNILVDAYVDTGIYIFSNKRTFEIFYIRIRT